MPASEEIRNANAYWIKRRAKWRRQYAILAAEIAFHKDQVSVSDTAGDRAMVRSLRATLSALQDKARNMMVERLVISGMLNATAYKWEDVG